MESTKPAVTYVGLDVSKDRLDYTLDGLRVAQVPNTPAGHARLVTQLRRQPGVRVVCEASGGSERAVVAHLLTAGLEVCVVHPGRVRAFAHAEGLLAKTDRIDAGLCCAATARKCNRAWRCRPIRRRWSCGNCSNIAGN